MTNTTQSSTGTTFTNPQGNLPLTSGNMEPMEGEQIIEVIEMENTPFTIVKTNERCFLSWGKWKLTDDMDTEEDVRLYVAECMWNVVGAWFVALSEAKQMEIDKAKEARNIKGKRVY